MHVAWRLPAPWLGAALILFAVPARGAPERAAPAAVVPRAPEVALRVRRGLVKFEIDAYASRVRFQTIEGVGRLVSGSYEPNGRRLVITIMLRDWTTRNRGRDADMHGQVLQTTQFPEARFVGTVRDWRPDGTATAVGALTLRDRTRKEFRVQARVERRRDGLLVRSQFVVRLSDFGIASPRNAYVFRVADTIRVRVLALFSEATP